jgi:hypothetical protein
LVTVAGGAGPDLKRLHGKPKDEHIRRFDATRRRGRIAFGAVNLLSGCDDH